MADEDIKSGLVSLEEKLYANETRADRESHLEIADPKVCAQCSSRACTLICPARTYTWSDEGDHVIVNYENCLECGACRASCPHAVISWRYPMGGMGIVYRYG